MPVISNRHQFDFQQFDLGLNTTVSDVEASEQSSEGEKTHFSSSAGSEKRKLLSLNPFDVLFWIYFHN